MIVKNGVSKTFDPKLSRAELRNEIRKEVARIQPQSILSRARTLLGIKERPSEKLLPWSKAAESNIEIAFADSTYFQKENGKKELETIYRNSWVLSRAINIRQSLKISRGLKINFENVSQPQKAKEVVDEFLKKLHPTRPMLALLINLKNIGIDCDIFGQGYWEKLFSPAGTLEKPIPVSKATSLEGIHPIHPIHLDFKRDFQEHILFKNGKPEAYVWKKDQETHEVELGRVAHLIYNKIGDEVLGMSLIEPIYKTVERLMKIEEGITQSILTHMPLYDVIIGDESHPATKEMIDETAEEVQGLNYKSEFVHPHWIRVSQLEAYSLGKAAEYMKPFITAVSSQSGVPEFALLGRGEGTNKATAQVMKEFIYQTVLPLQQIDAMFLEEQIFKPLMVLNGIKEVPEVEWNDITPQDALDAANTVSILAATQIDGKPVISMEEAREILKLGPSTYKGDTNKSEMQSTKIDGIYLVEPHGELIYEGKKTAIVKSVQFLGKTDKPLYLISDKKAYGIIKLNNPIKIDMKQFRRLKKFHMISDEEREKWWPELNELYFFKFNLLKKYPEPLEVSIPQGVQTFVDHDNIKFAKGENII